MDRKDIFKYGKVATAFMLFLSTFLTLIAGKEKMGSGRKAEKFSYHIGFNGELTAKVDGDKYSVEYFDITLFRVFFVLLAIVAIVFVFVKIKSAFDVSKIVYLGVSFVNIILFLIFQFGSKFKKDGLDVLKENDVKYHLASGWYVLLISIIGMFVLGLLDALPEIQKFLNSRPAPAAPQQPMMPPMGQPMMQQPPMGQPMNPNMPPMGQQPMMQQPPMGQPMQPPMGQPMNPNMPPRV